MIFLLVGNDTFKNGFALFGCFNYAYTAAVLICERAVDRDHPLRIFRRLGIFIGKIGIGDYFSAICFPGFEGELKGATISENPVCVDGKIVTAKGMGVAVQFGLTLAGLLTDKDVEKKIHDGIQCTD